MKERVATGRRKTAVASVRIREGRGSIDVNGRTLEQYFPNELQRMIVLAPMDRVGLKRDFDIIVRVRGGGCEAQAVAVRLGLSRALVQEDESMKPTLKEVGFLTRDGRKKERKKYGQAGARKRFQFSKR